MGIALDGIRARQLFRGIQRNKNLRRLRSA